MEQVPQRRDGWRTKFYIWLPISSNVPVQRGPGRLSGRQRAGPEVQGDGISKNSQAYILTDWEKLLAALEANKGDLAPVDPYSVQLEAELADLKAALARRSALRAELLQTTKNIRCYVALGKDLTIRIRGWNRSQYGHRSEKLAEFGIKPVRKRRPPRARPASEVSEQGTPWNPTSRCFPGSGLYRTAKGWVAPPERG